MIDTVLIGGGYSDIFNIIEDINAKKKIINLIAVVDSKRANKKKIFNVQVVKDLSMIRSKKKPYLINGVASSIRARNDVFKSYKSNNYLFYNLIHPSVNKKNLSIGEGNIICNQCHIGKNLKMGKNNLIGPQCFIGHDSIIGDSIIFGPAAKIMGSVNIKNDVIIGAGSLVLENLYIEKNSILSFGSVLFTNLKKNSFAIGNPARISYKK